MQDTPEIMAISNALARKAGQHATRVTARIGAFDGTILSAARYPQTATKKVACSAFMCTYYVVTDLTS